MTTPSPLTRRSLLAGSAAVAAGAASAGLGLVPTADAATIPGHPPFAIWDPVSGRSTTPMAPHRVTVHIAVTHAADIYGPNKGPGGTYAHFYNPRSGAPRHHQTMDKRAAADLDGNQYSISVEHAGVVGDSMTDSQLTNLAKIFAWAVVHHGVLNRIVTVNDLRGLAWHRLGIDGNFGAYNPNDRTTWCRKQTGVRWSTVYGKTCPTNNFIRQIPTVFSRAQYWINQYR